MKELPFDPYDLFGYIASGALVIVGLELTVGVPNVLGKEHEAFDLFLVSLATYIAGQIVATPSKSLLEDIILHRLLKKPSINLMQSQERSPLLRRIFPSYYQPLPAEIQSRILLRAESEGLTSPTGEALFLHIRFRDYIRADAALMSRLHTFLNKYGFNRNLSFTAFLFGMSVLSVNGFDVARDDTKYALIALICGALLFVRYMKFFRQYSYELFNSYAGKS